MGQRVAARVRGSVWRRFKNVMALAVGLVLLVLAVRLTAGGSEPARSEVPLAAAAEVDVPALVESRMGDIHRQVRQVLEDARAAHVAEQRERRKERREARAKAQAEARAKKAARLARKADRLAREARAPKSSTFRVGSFNILGSNHTRKGGRYGPGVVRAGLSSELIRSRGVDVVGLQEVQDDQLNVFVTNLSEYTVWPQHALGRNGQRLQIVYRTDRFEAVESGNIWHVFTSQRIPVPYIRLRDRETRAEFWVVTVHNSAGGLEAQRDASTDIEIALLNRLRATGKPVLIMGDMNEHTEFFQRVCTATGFLAANGGGPGCALPGGPLRVDWIMGGGGDGVTFSGYVQDGASRARASDHYFIHANVTMNDPGEQ